MSAETRDYAAGTALTQSYPWGWYRGGRALCADGRVRALKRVSETADTFFSVPAAVAAYGRTVAGYVTVEALSGAATATAEDPAVVRFVAYQYRSNAATIAESGPCAVCGDTRSARQHDALRSDPRDAIRWHSFAVGVGCVDERGARRIASEWHGGQSSAFYSFASAGHIDRPRMLAEIAECEHAAIGAETSPAEQRGDLAALRSFVDSQEHTA